MTNIIKSYLDDFAKSSIEFSKKYNPNLIDKCIDFINKKAREIIKGNMGFVDDNIVFKWARDYFNDDVYSFELAQEEQKKQQAEQNKINFELKQQEIKKEQQKKQRQEIFSDPNSLFFGLDDELDTSKEQQKEEKQEIQTTLKIKDYQEQAELFLEEEPEENSDVIFDDEIEEIDEIEEEGEENNALLHIF